MNARSNIFVWLKSPKEIVAWGVHEELNTNMAVYRARPVEVYDAIDSTQKNSFFHLLIYIPSVSGSHTRANDDLWAAN